jgi:hypothetical protein
MIEYLLLLILIIIIIIIVLILPIPKHHTQPKAPPEVSPEVSLSPPPLPPADIDQAPKLTTTIPKDKKRVKFNTTLHERLYNTLTGDITGEQYALTDTKNSNPEGT